MEADKRLTNRVVVRITQDDLSRVKAFMEMGGYRTISRYLRDLLLQRRLPYRTAVPRVSDRELRDRVNALIYQVNKIGVNYNQVVATWQKQSKQTRPDGTPYMDTRSVEARLVELMRSTESLRDEFAVLLDVIRKYIGESQPITNP